MLPSQTGPTIEEKVEIYLAAGVCLVWVIDPVQESVHVYRQNGASQLLTAQDMLEGDDVLPGFRIPVADLFA